MEKVMSAFSNGKFALSNISGVFSRVLMQLAFLALCILTLSAAPGVVGQAQADEWQDVSASVQVTVSNPVRNRRDPHATVNVTVKNTGTAALKGPVRLILSDLTSGVSLANGTGEANGFPYVNVLPSAGQSLAAGASSRQITLRILNGGSKNFSFNPRVEQFVPTEVVPLSVKITEPASLVTVGHTPMRVRGTINQPGAQLVINGIAVPYTGDSFEAQVALIEGYNTIIAGATNATGEQVTDSIVVSLDQTPPYVTIESHTDGQVVSTDRVTITGLVNDIVRGTVEEHQANVRVNGIVATVSNRSYSAREVPLVEGPNTITVTASDQVGNTESTQLTINYKKPLGKRIELVGGQGQSAEIEDVLASPLVVKVLEADGSPAQGSAVVFRVVQGSGLVAVGTEQEGRAVVIETDEDGLASTSFRLGQRTGTDNHKVRALVVGYEGEVMFSASAKPRIGDKLSINSGNNQRGAVGLPLPAPFVTVVTDSGANVVKGARVRFEVTTGGGHFQNGEAIYETLTDSDGRATAQLTLGNLTGIDAQRVTAVLIDAPEGEVINAGFTATAFVSGDPGQTSVSGVILDNQDQPIPGVTVHIEGTSRKAETDEQGQFKITSAPVGPIHLVADGSTAKVPGEFPSLGYRLVTIAGVDNPLSAPIYMVKLNTDEAVYAGPKDVELTLEKFPGFKLEIAKNSVTFPDGSREGLVSVTSVNAATVPMAPPNGMQPQFIVTIQPTNTRFDPPARLSLPNVDGHAPGAQVEMYSYDHDLEEFVAIGLGTVSEDGSVIRSNPGVGVVKAGWHCGSQPGGSGCASNCGDCRRCEGNCNCVTDDSQTPKSMEDVPGDCKTPGCKGGTPTQVPKDSDIDPEDAKCKKCSEGSLIADSSKNDNQCGDGSPQQACLVCVDGNCQRPDCKASKEKHVFESTAPQFVLDALTQFQSTLNSSPVFQASLKPEISVSMEAGETCCKDCENAAEPKAYKKFSGKAGLKGNVKVSVPGLGGAYKMPARTFGGYAVKAEAFFTAAGANIDLDASGAVNYMAVECPGENCGSFDVGSNLSATIGPQLDVSASVVSCANPADQECNDSVVLLAGTAKGSLAVKVQGFLGGKWSSDAQCGGSCLGGQIQPVSGVADFSVGVEILFKKYTYSASSDPIVFWEGGSFGPGC